MTTTQTQHKHNTTTTQINPNIQGGQKMAQFLYIS